MEKAICLLVVFFLAAGVRAQTCRSEPLKIVIPGYSMSAMLQSVSGQVKVKVAIDSLGKVTNAAAEGPAELQRVSEAAAERWEYSKIKKNSSGQCAVRKSFIIFSYTLLPAGSTGEGTRSFVILPNRVEIKVLKEEFNIDPSIDPAMEPSTEN